MATNAYTLTFRGDIVGRFSSVHSEVAVILEYKKYRSPAHPLVQSWYKTDKVALQMAAQFSRYPGQNFVVRVSPGTSEITEAQIVTKTAKVVA